MEAQPQPQQTPQPGIDPLQNNLGYIPQRGYDIDAMMSKHLDASDILTTLKNTLLGMEYDEEKDEWEQAEIVIGYDEKGKEVKTKEPPLMSPRDIRVTIGYLQMFLNPNTFLSQVNDEKINDIMWDVNKKLAILFYNLRHKVTTHERDMLWGMIEYPIFLGLNRASSKITLDAISKTQQTHELIQANPKPQREEEKFKLF